MAYLVWGTMEVPGANEVSMYESAYECDTMDEAADVARKMFVAATGILRKAQTEERRKMLIQVDIYSDQPPLPLWLVRVKFKARAKWNCWRKAEINREPVSSADPTS